jgi:hypothetical protein
MLLLLLSEHIIKVGWMELGVLCLGELAVRLPSLPTLYDT